MLFKTLLLSSCAIAVMASSFSASAMMKNDDDDNDKVQAGPALNPNAPIAPAVNPDTVQAPATPAVTPKAEDSQVSTNSTSRVKRMEELGQADAQIVENIVNDIVDLIEKPIDFQRSNELTSKQLEKYKSVEKKNKATWLVKRKKIEKEARAYINKKISEGTAAGEPVDLSNLWKSGSVVTYFKEMEKQKERKAESKMLKHFQTNSTRVILGAQGLTKLPSLLNQYISLQELDLGWNYLTSLKGIENMKNLQVLNLSRNRLTSLEGLEKLPKLRLVKISHNGGTLDMESQEILRDLEARGVIVER